MLAHGHVSARDAGLPRHEGNTDTGASRPSAIRPRGSAKVHRRKANAATDENRATLRTFVVLIALFPILMFGIAPVVGDPIAASVLIGMFYVTLLALTQRSGGRTHA